MWHEVKRFSQVVEGQNYFRRIQSYLKNLMKSKRRVYCQKDLNPLSIVLRKSPFLRNNHIALNKFR